MTEPNPDPKTIGATILARLMPYIIGFLIALFTAGQLWLTNMVSNMKGEVTEVKDKQIEAKTAATQAVAQASKAAEVGLEAKVLSTEIAVDRGIVPPNAVKEAKAELQEHKAATQEAK